MEKKEATKFKIERKKEKDETASPSTPRLSIDAQTTTFDMDEMKKKSSVRELQGLLRSCSFQHIENIFEDFLPGKTLARKTRHRLLYTSNSPL